MAPLNLFPRFKIESRAPFSPTPGFRQAADVALPNTIDHHDEEATNFDYSRHIMYSIIISLEKHLKILQFGLLHSYSLHWNVAVPRFLWLDILACGGFVESGFFGGKK